MRGTALALGAGAGIALPSNHTLPRKMGRTIAGVFWIGLYLLLVLVPVFLMLVPPVPSGRGFWLEFSVALGFVGLTQLALQFILIARFRRVTAPYGIDIILRYHRRIAVVATGLIIAHPLIIVADNPSRLKLLDPLGGNWASRAGLVSIAALAAIAFTSLLRERLSLRYERWRLSHILLSLVALVFAQVHVSLAGLYTNTAWKQAIWIATAAITAGLVIYLRVLKPARQRNYRWRVAEVRRETPTTHSLVLEAVGHEGIDFAPGQFAWIKLAGTPFTLEEHPFSMSSSAERRDRLEFGIKSLGDFTSRVDSIPAGTRAFIDGPHGAFTIDRYPAAGYVFFAGGIGITPIISILRTLADRADPRPILLIYAEKSWEETAYSAELQRLESALDLTTVFVLEEPPAEWDGEVGLVDEALLGRVLPVEKFRRAHFICGPPPMMDAVKSALLARGVAEAQIQLEKFVLA